MSDYRVNLEVFDGPLDLLLYLVRKEEVDIYDIPISRITEQYIQYIQMMQTLDIDLAGDFLVMAATLMEIKSAMLLPRTDEQAADTAQPDDPRAELVRQLLEYKRIKDAANMLSEAAETRLHRFTRPDSILSSIKQNNEPELDLDQVSIWTLLEAFDSIMKSTGFVSGYEHISDETSIDLYQIDILHRLQTEGPMTLRQVFCEKPSRLIMIGLFLGMLELIRNQLIFVEQPEAAGDIYLKSITDKPAEQAVQEAIFARQVMEAQQPQQEPEPQEKTLFDEPAAPQAISQNEEDDDDDDDDALTGQLNAIEVPDIENAAQPAKPRIPIVEIPASQPPKHAAVETPHSAAQPDTR